jgi:hypothetical protein
MPALFKIEYKKTGAGDRQRLENIPHGDLILIVRREFRQNGRMPSKVWQLVNRQWRLLTLAAFAELFK